MLLYYKEFYKVLILVIGGEGLLYRCISFTLYNKEVCCVYLNYNEKCFLLVTLLGLRS